jgi:hypothetical protein
MRFGVSTALYDNNNYAQFGVVCVFSVLNFEMHPWRISEGAAALNVLKKEMQQERTMGLKV